MVLTHLSLTDFRNLTRLDVQVPEGIVVILGPNAQGKTSILEAIYMLATLTSFHAESDRQVINFFAAREKLSVARIVADICRGQRTVHIEVRIIQERVGVRGNPRVRKEVLVDGLKKKAAEAIGTFNAVLFLPQMLQVVEGSPRHRRRYLDLALAQVMPDYTATLSTYNRALSQRNALLKQLGEQGGDAGQLAYWDEQVANLGARLIFARIQAIQEIEMHAGLIHHELTDGKEVLRVHYQPAYDPIGQPDAQFALELEDQRDRSGFGLEQIQSGFVQALQGNRREEIARGVTTIGPHRDEVRFISNGVDLGTFGSRGQIRTTLLTLKLAEAAWMHKKSGHRPVFLLDEVLAELDIYRRADLLERVSRDGQWILTTTDRKLFTAEFLEQAQIWQIENGQLRADS